MRKNFDQPILDLDDKPIINDKKEIATLATIIINALLANYEDERPISGQDKADRMYLALAIRHNPREVDVSAEQLSMIKLLIGKAYGPLVVGRAYELLERDLAVVKEA